MHGRVEFIERYAAFTGRTVDDILKYMIAIPAALDGPCDYGEDCEGWHMLRRTIVEEEVALGWRDPETFAILQTAERLDTAAVPPGLVRVGPAWPRLPWLCFLGIHRPYARLTVEWADTPFLGRFCCLRCGYAWEHEREGISLPLAGSRAPNDPPSDD